MVQSVVLYLLGIYIDQIWQKETGKAKHPFFCFKRRKSSRISSKAGSQNPQDSSQVDKSKQAYLEEVEDQLKIQSKNLQTLEISNLSKIYPNKKHAVKNLNLTMYTDQIFALLGHNGAGKTTTISMISGLIPINEGDIKVLGYDTETQSEAITNMMGICPQTNPIYPKLTCYEHLRLYSQIKSRGLSDAEREEEIIRLLKDIDLFDKKDFLAGDMSGGQKRKLCVACAFIGGSKVILLDEPTSGLDVSARRHLWNMLKKYKREKIIILTTHFMDEADYLGDRIGVMGDGELLTCGSALFLKSKFGFGYTLTLVKAESEVPTATITKLIRQHVFEAKLEGDIGKELKYILPTKDLQNYEKLFIDLDTQLGTLGLSSYGVSLTTLEDVFLKIGQELGEHKETLSTPRTINPDGRSSEIPLLDTNRLQEQYGEILE